MCIRDRFIADLKGPLCGEGREGRKERVGGKGRKGERRQRLSQNKNPGYGLSNLTVFTL